MSIAHRHLRTKGLQALHEQDSVKVNSPVRPAWQFCLKRLSGIARTRRSSVLKGFQALHEQDTAVLEGFQALNEQDTALP